MALEPKTNPEDSEASLPLLLSDLESDVSLEKSGRLAAMEPNEGWLEVDTAAADPKTG